MKKNIKSNAGHEKRDAFFSIVSRITHYALLFCLTFVITAQAVADLSSTSYRIVGPVISSGGMTEMISTNNKLLDTKSFYGGVLSSVNNIIQLGGIYLLTSTGTSGGGGITPPAVPVGTVPLVITRVGNNIKISWDQATYPNPLIFFKTGDGTGQYVNTYKTGATINWSNFISPGPTDREYHPSDGYVLYKNQVGLGDREVYFKALVGTTDPSNIGELTRLILLAQAVGKVNINLPANKYVFSSLPFQNSGVSLSNSIIADQLPSGSEFLWWDEDAQGYKGSTYSEAWSGSDRNLNLGEGFILRCPTDKVLTIVGDLLRASRRTRAIATDKYSLLSYPYPNNVNFSRLGIAPIDGDELLKWKVDTQGYIGATFSSGAWVGPAEINVLGLADPRFYRPKADINQDSDSIVAP